eukprot:TRINITY_DN3006_c0_g1_i2.p1 TRINITY_DN3006_c0_g1~~TRINITY_DN3006_c0_g1_i2.p1  ORF type:complete len:182 (-),score=30.76 TRINITY_DN3006_c0_g1_i2:81-590(-)
MSDVSFSIAVLTISDSRNEADDRSGPVLVERLEKAGHNLFQKVIVQDDIYQIRSQVSQWIASTECQIILTTGGTGVTGRDVTPEAIRPLLDKEIEGFGEIFRSISYQEIGVSGLQSRAFCGSANGKYLFCLPGSSNACSTAWDKLILDMLNPKTKGCSLGKLITRLKEK